MKGFTTKQILSPGFVLPKDKNDLESVYRTLAKSADQRLVRLEKYSEEENMGDALRWAYARAERDIKAWSGDEAKRFNTAPPKTKQGLIAKIKDIQTFLEAPSSTKQGIKKIYIDRAKSINKKFGTNFTWQDMGDFFEGQMYQELDAKKASNTIVEAFGAMMQNKDKVKKALDKLDADKRKPKAKQQTINISDDAILEKTIKEIIKDYPDEVRDLLDL